MTLWTGAKKLHLTSDDKIEPNEEGRSEKCFSKKKKKKKNNP